MLDKQQQLLDEKAILGRELNHRVRNNLQLVHGMLERQLRITRGKDETRGINAIARRVMALARIYDHLLGIGLGNTIDFGEYLSELCPSIAEAAKAERPNVKLTCQCDQLILDLDAVTSLGLVVTELIANCYEHAFPDGAGSINVSLSGGRPGDIATITVSDDGIGFKEKNDSKRNGLGLVKRLVEQVKCSVALRSDNGTKWILSIPMDTPRSANASVQLAN